MRIKKVRALEILDSRGIPTISTTITLSDGSIGTGAVPGGASTGNTEVLELRDGDKNRYFGKGVLKAVEIVNNNISKYILNKDFNTQEEFDRYLIQLDGTELKKRLGGNSILSLSMAFFKASAKSKGIQNWEYFSSILKTPKSLPTPLILIMEGGAHGNWSTDFQEYMIVPNTKKFPSYSEMLRGGAEVFKATHDVLIEMGYSANVGFEGAYTPMEIKSNNEAFDIILKGIEKAGYIPDKDFQISIDIAASEFFNNETKKYDLKKEGLSLSSEEWSNTIISWLSKYPIFSIEDMFDQEDWHYWSMFTKEFGNKYMTIGDDLLTTNVRRIQKGIDVSACNTVLIKLNQIGTVTETLDAIKLCKENNLKTVISHRGGETNDDLIADLVVGTNSKYCKFGGPDRGERLAKYNRLLEIEND